VLTAAEIAAMQDTQNAALPDTCTIKQRTFTADTVGGRTEGEITRATNVACRLGPYRAPSEGVVAEQLAGHEAFVLTLAAGQVIEVTDQVIISSDSYEVVGIESAGAWETARRVIVARRR